MTGTSAGATVMTPPPRSRINELDLRSYVLREAETHHDIETLVLVQTLVATLRQSSSLSGDRTNQAQLGAELGGGAIATQHVLALPCLQPHRNASSYLLQHSRSPQLML
jgi:hypothetical protein